MRAVVQRVSRAKVTVADAITGEIGRGLEFDQRQLWNLARRVELVGDAERGHEQELQAPGRQAAHRAAGERDHAAR